MLCASRSESTNTELNSRSKPKSRLKPKTLDVPVPSLQIKQQLSSPMERLDILIRVMLRFCFCCFFCLFQQVCADDKVFTRWLYFFLSLIQHHSHRSIHVLFCKILPHVFHLHLCSASSATVRVPSMWQYNTLVDNLLSSIIAT